MTASAITATGTGATALVTGATKNIGLAIVRGLARNGVHVWLGARRLDAGQRAAAELARDGLAVDVVELDVTDAASIARAASAIGDHLDILVNNAGITDPIDGPALAAELDGVRRVFETNFFGALAVTRAMLPALRRSRAGRIVNVSSSLGSIALTATPEARGRMKLVGYQASKAALDMLTVMLAHELADTPIKVNAAAPGYTPTNLNTHLPTPANVRAQTPDDAAVIPIRLALLAADGASGTFVSINGAVPW